MKTTVISWLWCEFITIKLTKNLGGKKTKNKPFDKSYEIYRDVHYNIRENVNYYMDP